MGVASASSPTSWLLGFEPPARLAHTFIASWYGERDDHGSPHWEIVPTESGCRVILTHRGARGDTREGSETADGSRKLIEGLKSLLEENDRWSLLLLSDARAQFSR